MARVAVLVIIAFLWQVPHAVQADEEFTTRRVCKIVGSTRTWDTDAGITVLNDGFKGVWGADLVATSSFRIRPIPPLLTASRWKAT